MSNGLATRFQNHNLSAGTQVSNRMTSDYEHELILAERIISSGGLETLASAQVSGIVGRHCVVVAQRSLPEVSLSL